MVKILTASDHLVARSTFCEDDISTHLQEVVDGLYRSLDFCWVISRSFENLWEFSFAQVHNTIVSLWLLKQLASSTFVFTFVETIDLGNIVIVENHNLCFHVASFTEVGSQSQALRTIAKSSEFSQDALFSDDLVA